MTLTQLIAFRPSDRRHSRGTRTMQIKNSTFIVTGGASGLGEATVTALHQRNANVVIADRDNERGQALSDK
ncbi:MAG: SDR family NAD(P)-dependent oxidoreductase, partial [Pusillimonas sp.]